MRRTGRRSHDVLAAGEPSQATVTEPVPWPAAEPPAGWLRELGEWIALASVSADPACVDATVAAGEWAARALERCGGVVTVAPSAERPLLVARVAASEGVVAPPTVMLYGHYDVQPAGDPGLWSSPPFEASVRDGWVHGRGVADDKGNVFVALKALERLVAAGELPVDVLVVLDGEEEVDGPAASRFVAACEEPVDGCVVWDGALGDDGAPQLVFSTRGTNFYRLEVETAAADLHSGQHGGVALNALHVLMGALRAVVPPPPALRAGARAPDPDDDPAEVAVGLGTSVDVHGIAGGEPELQKTIIPARAACNVSVRLAPGQDAQRADAAFRAAVRAAVPSGATLELHARALVPPADMPRDAPILALAGDALARVLGRPARLVRAGGTIPVMAALTARGIPVATTGVAPADANVHAPDERFPLALMPLGADAAGALLQALAALPRRR